MYSAINGSELYQERLKKDMVLTLVTQYPAGQVVRACDILELDQLGSQPRRELLEQILVPVMEKLKARQIDYSSQKEREDQAHLNTDFAETAATTHKIDVLF
ncbi:hypothetical protein VIBNISOn1_190025 [Vibrio nigripulchritudo SOn1]|uniref:Uncharacterized protein n=1 Tax=Vibrio nigripulchritudo SOn1 TaxID=1238450 RepID=A0AAV2VQ49_9VIBR|nr:hypothetical protein [Vibrio nigripulchritudo]CCO46806.1 hypothetical protein VIBNISOn1_190025 [Vibrio nigripulchritudo SOn1]